MRGSPAGGDSSKQPAADSRGGAFGKRRVGKLLLSLLTVGSALLGKRVLGHDRIREYGDEEQLAHARRVLDRRGDSLSGSSQAFGDTSNKPELDIDLLN